MIMENNEIFYGYVPTKFDGTEYIVSSEQMGTLPLPIAYSYLNFMSPVMNQGSESTCVPHSVSAVYDYYLAMNNPETTDEDGKFSLSGISIHQIYNCRTNRGEGMSYKEAFEFCRKNGVISEQAYRKKLQEEPRKILMYGRIMSLEVLKRAIVANGPCPIATMVKNPAANDFWNGNGNYGGHATCLIGYDDRKSAFLLRNSWGTGFANRGYTWFPYEDFNKILEAWTVIA